MAGVIDAIGLVSGVLGIVGFFQDNIAQADPQGAKIRVKAGLGSDGEGGEDSLVSIPNRTTCLN
jgi:hypothetical protein